MKDPEDRTPEPTSDADDVRRLGENLTALGRDLSELEELTKAALGDAHVDPGMRTRIELRSGRLGYAELSEENARRRTEEDWGEPDLLALLTEEQRATMSSFTDHQRLGWNAEDLFVVGLTASFGVLSATFDLHADALVAEGLGWLKSTATLKRWEAEAVRMSIDYTGTFFGGPDHRVRSAGHDLMRLVSALDQVRSGTFRGTTWIDGRRVVVETMRTSHGTVFRIPSDTAEALGLILKHWVADVVTPMSLPLPGFSFLAEMPSDRLRDFATRAYGGLEFGALGSGLNLRSGILTPSLAELAREVLVRAHLHVQQFRATGSFVLDAARVRKRTAMLLAAHGATSAASLSKAAIKTSVLGPLALRHLDVSALVRTGRLALEWQRGPNGDDNWEDLARDVVRDLDAKEIAHLADLLADISEPGPHDPE